MDTIDKKLIYLLAENADVSTAYLAPKLNLSISAVNKRITRLKEEGIIRKTVVITDSGKVGKEVVAFVLISLEQFGKSEGVFKAMEDEEILECYAITGEYDYILKVCTSSINALEEKLLEMKRRGIAKTFTTFALREYKCEHTVLPQLNDESK